MWAAEACIIFSRNHSAIFRLGSVRSLSHAVPVFCVRGALFPWHLTHLQWDAARLLHLYRGKLTGPLRCGGGRIPREGGPRGSRTFKEGRHLLDVLHCSEEREENEIKKNRQQEKTGNLGIWIWSLRVWKLSQRLGTASKSCRNPS